MRTCDLCGSVMETDAKQTSICIGYSCSAWQRKEIDMCDECKKTLRNVLSAAEAEFYQKMILKGAPTKTFDLRNEYDKEAFERELMRGNEYLEYTKKIMSRGRCR